MSKHAILFYNTENLYDTVDDPLVKDSAFTPKGFKHWTLERYHKKLDDVANVICTAPGRFPVLIGLAEVENKVVLNDLIDKTDLCNRPYRIVHEHSPDSRGIDVSLLYDKEYFDYISHESIHVTFPWNSAIQTRDILFVKGRIMEEEVFIFVNHWPSRNKGAKETEEKRMHVAGYVRKKIDEVFMDHDNPNIILMGDFNDEPYDRSLEYVLKSRMYTNIESDELFNLMSEDFEKHRGTNVYQDDWLMFDQFHVSQNLIDRSEGIFIDRSRAYIYYSDKVLYKSRSGMKKPDETYSGDKYTGGVSDHLAVYCFLVKK